MAAAATGSSAAVLPRPPPWLSLGAAAFGADTAAAEAALAAAAV